MRSSTEEIKMEHLRIFEDLTVDKGSCRPPTAIRSCSSFSKDCSNYLTIEPDALEQRRHSMPDYDTSSSGLSTLTLDVSNLVAPSGIRRVRSFRTTAKGVVNGGDTWRSPDTGTSVWSGCTVTINQQYETMTTRKLSTTSQDSGAGNSWTSSGAPSYFRVLLLGSPGVGKKSLTNQFRSSATSEATSEFSAWDETVSMLLDDEESLVEFCSYPDDQLPDADVNMDAYVVVYSMASHATYTHAIAVIKHLRNVVGTDRSIMLVANKSDLVRNRAVRRDDVRQVASQYACKYVETSAALHHNVDELLVGIVSQIRIKLNPAKLASYAEKYESVGTPKSRRVSMSAVKGFFNRVFHREASLSCDNLYDI